MKLKMFLLAGLLAATCAQAGNTAKIYYNTSYKGWSTVHMHFKPQGGSWTVLPGPKLSDACPNWKVGVIDIGTASQWEAAFNNGQGAWDNLDGVAGRNYQLGLGVTQI